jgi:hypothetical protein
MRSHSQGTTGFRYCSPARVFLGVCDIAKTRHLAAAVAAVFCRTIFVYRGAARTANKTVRLSVRLPAGVAARVRRLAKARGLSANRMLLELIGNGLEAEKHIQQEFFGLAARFRCATDPDHVNRLGDRMGRMVFAE